MGNSTVKNNEDMNIIKGICIILMVMGHAESPLNSFLYLFHMAAFIFVSGYFYNSKYDRNFILLVKKRLKSLYLPYVKYIIIFYILNNIFYNLKLVGSYIEFDKSNFLKIIRGILTFNAPIDTLGSFWFIKTLFLCTLLFGLISFIIRRIFINNYEKIRGISILVMFFIGNLMLNISEGFSRENIVKVLMCIPIFYIGVLYKKYEERILIKKEVALGFIIFLLISSYQGKVDISYNIYTNAVFFIGNSIMGIYLLIYISKKFQKFERLKLVQYIGKNTLPILAAHWICFSIVDNYVYFFNQNYRWILCTILGVAIPLCINFAVYRVVFFLKKYIN